jgi:glutaredoxin 3
MADVKVYITDYCPYCTRAKGLLRRKGVTFTEIDVTHDPDKRTWLTETTGQRTVPQIFINDRPVGGADDLYALDREGKLDALLAEPAPSMQP